MLDVNGWGFPIENCERCKGSGHYSFNPVDGTRCYGCNGRGTTITKNAQDAWSQFQYALHTLRNPAVQDIQAGEVLRVTVKNRQRNATVLAVAKADALCDGIVEYEVTLRIGKSVIIKKVLQNCTVRRVITVGNIDAAPFFAMIKKVK